MFRPSLKTLRRGTCVAVFAATIAVSAIVAPVASASSCGSQTLSSPFGRFGDWNQYYLAPGGSFESGGWSGGSVVSGNEPWKLNSIWDSHALQFTGQVT